MYSVYLVLLLLIQAVPPSGTSHSTRQPSVSLQLFHRFGDEDLKLDKEYTSGRGDKVRLTRFKYYLSNIELTLKDGTTRMEPQRYHLVEVNEDVAEPFRIELKDISLSECTRLSFAIGVDSISNHSGRQEGALNPDHGMFWMWETGYVFFKVEGYYKSVKGSAGAMVYHIGRDNCYRKVTLSLSNKLMPSAANVALNVVADVQKLFESAPGTSINLLAPVQGGSISVMGGDRAAGVANNFAQIFSIAK